MPKNKEIAGCRVLAKIGEGAASTLYAVQDPKTKQVWALKHVEKHTDKDQRFLDQVEAEYQVGVKLDHPFVRHIEKLIKHRKRFRVVAMSLIMELVDGATLEQKTPKSHAPIVRIFQHVAEGLAHMHGRGFVHADLKPSNIIVTDQDHVKIIDLGQGCPVGTVKTRIQGTPGYMAPEQAHRQAITPKTDVYNFGATMYWVLVREVIPTALPPKDDSNSLFSGALDAEMVEAPVPPDEKNPKIHPLLSKQILDCVKIDPDDRPESMEFVANRLELIADLLESPPEERETIEDEETQA
ncbi:MAG: serine/threonine protein kinase [Phycisphaerales bacterium]|nr:serine/threonine protein kinase [Phycisphaerae bacterium]NNF42035.1 serine/threonine protein kinase [Phycisphaerales bacterium]NNM26007.1 serine/threonine protein kinase [Phycisphaerales bacterium]